MPRQYFKSLLIAVAALLLLGACWIIFLFTRAAPEYAGHEAMPGLSATVNVYRDEHGVPHIFAATMDDAARALGYIHADERLFQMEMNRRAGAGRLSEIFGEDTLDIDKFTRTLGLYMLAQESFTAMSPDAQKFLQAYADGVNEWLETHQHNLPPEFFILGITPERWTPADSLVWARLMALQLSDNYKREILRARLAGKLTPEEIKTLLPPPPADAPVTTRPSLTKTGALDFVIPGRAKREPGIPFPIKNKTNDSPIFDRLGALTNLTMAASNEWVIGGARTQSGKPILANDPHLGLEAPILWYLARIKTPEDEIEGATVPGLPVVLLGQNTHIAWGFTTTGSDVQDLFIETVDPHNPDQYLAPGGAVPFTVRDEIIKIKGAPDQPLHVRVTRHGPVMSDIDPDLAVIAGEGKMVALSFTALNGNDATAEALMRINRAKNWQEFLDALKLYQAPPQNIVYADTDGNIGFIGAGLVPIRKKGNGLAPVDGASGDYDWSGTIPINQWPQLYNPPAGFAFNANNAIVGPDSAYWYGQDWEEPFRAERLQQFFNTLDKHTLDTSAAMQADCEEPAAKQLLPYLLKQNFSDPRAVQAQAMLKNWNAVMDKDKPEPLIFDAWLYEMHQKILADKAGDPLKAAGPFDALALADILAKPGSWCGDNQDCDGAIQQSFIAALDLLEQRDGKDMGKWRWGDEQLTVLRHKFWSHIPVLRGLTDISVPSSGDFYTLNRGGSSVTDPKHPFERTHGAGYRGLYDLGDPSKSRFMIATGESGHVLTQHYGDLVKPWNEVQSFTLTGTENELKSQGMPELTFEPDMK